MTNGGDLPFSCSFRWPLKIWDKKKREALFFRQICFLSRLNLLCDSVKIFALLLVRVRTVFLVSPGTKSGYIRLPQSQIIMYSFIWRTAIVWKIKIFLAVRRGWAWWPFTSVVLTVRFPIKWLGNVWEPAPPRSMGLSRPYFFYPRFLGLTLRHRIAVTWTYDWHAWFSPIHTFINISNNTFYNCKFWSLE
jgi:hypothetical protein